MDDDTNYEGEDHYHAYRRSQTTDYRSQLYHASEAGEDCTYIVQAMLDGVGTTLPRGAALASCTIAPPTGGTVSGDLPEAVIEDDHTHYTIYDDGFPVGVATDQGYHHHISIPHLGFETVKENVKNWAVETGYTLATKD